MITVLKSKIQTAVITAASKEYNGSITIDEDLMDAAGLYQWEKVEINARDKKVRVKTYVIKGERGTRCIEANGGLAQYFEVGDIVHILSYKDVEQIDYPNYNPLVVISYDSENIIFGDK